MEKHFSFYFVVSSIDRIRQLFIYLWIPVIFPFRCSRIMYLILYHGIDNLEFWGAVIRLVSIAFTLLMLFKAMEWSDVARHRLGLFILWTTRVFFLILILEQTKQDRDANTIFSFITCFFLGGFATPNFSEYMALAILASLVRPGKLLMSHWPSYSEQIAEITYQHTLILALCIGVHWTVHSDIRREWLRSPSLRFDPEKPGTRADHDEGGERRNAEDEWDLLRDDYFSHADHMDMSAQAQQVFFATSHRWRGCRSGRGGVRRSGPPSRSGLPGRRTVCRGGIVRRTSSAPGRRAWSMRFFAHTHISLVDSNNGRNSAWRTKAFSHLHFADALPATTIHEPPPPLQPSACAFAAIQPRKCFPESLRASAASAPPPQALAHSPPPSPKNISPESVRRSCAFAERRRA